MDQGVEVYLELNSRGDLLEDVKFLIERLNLQKNVKLITDFLEWSDLGKIYARNNVYFFPCKFSNGNLSLREMMISGCAVVLSETSLDCECLNRDFSGYICSEDQDYIDALIALTDKRTLESEIQKNHAYSKNWASQNTIMNYEEAFCY